MAPAARQDLPGKGLRPMGMTYFKRFRMEIALGGRDFSALPPLDGYSFLPWRESLLDAHAEAKYLSFRFEIDANVFPCLGDLPGCVRSVTMLINRCGGLILADDTVRTMPIPNSDEWKQLRLF